MMVDWNFRALSWPPLGLLQGASLFLDFDGTLVSIAERPDAVKVEARLRRLLMRLHGHLDGRMAIVSGRAATDVAALLANPELIIAGSHGAEFWRPSATAAASPPLVLGDHASRLLRQLLDEHSGLLAEHKPAGLALHYRQAPEAEARCREVAERLARDAGLDLLPGKMVIELRMPGSDKGTAVATLMEQAPLRDGRPIFIGDDITDEAGFRAAADRGGAGILVGEPRATRAHFRLLDVDATLGWLEAAIEAPP